MRIITAGDNCVDYYVDSDIGYPGGNPVNVAVYCKRYFEDVSYIGVVGDDRNGEVILSSLKRKGVDVSDVHVVEGKTSVTRVKIVNGDRCFCGYDQGVHASFRLSDGDLGIIKGADMFISGFWGRIDDAIGEIKRQTPSIITAFDFADKLDAPLAAGISKYIDYSFFSWTGSLDFGAIEKFMREKKEFGSKAVVVTLGKDGSICFDGDKFCRYGIIPCKVCDTMGAGDSFIAGFMCSILSGGTIPEAMRQGTEGSTVTIQYKGAW